MELTLGRFGDVRLQKRGAIFWSGSLRAARTVSASGLWAVIGRERSALAGFFVIPV